MLTPEQFDAVIEPLLELYETYQQSVLNDIARRLVKMGEVTPTAAWQVQHLSESGALYEAILERLAQLTGKTADELRKAFARAGVKAIGFDDAIYLRAGLKPTPLNLSPAMLDVLRAGMVKTGGLISNLTLSTAISGQNAFIEAADLAYMQVTTGTMSYTQAIRAGVERVAGEGLSVVQYAGRKEQLDVALRRAVLTGVSQTVGEVQMLRADEMGCDLVEVSAHVGARNTGEGPANHESWQGRIYSRSGTHAKFPPFAETTGYGTGEGLGGWNCRHSWFPFFEGLSEPTYTQSELDDLNRTVTYNERSLSLYEASQLQRAIERSIRKAKRQRSALEAAGLDAAAETARVRSMQARMRDFLKQTGLQRQREREQI